MAENTNYGQISAQIETPPEVKKAIAGSAVYEKPTFIKKLTDFLFSDKLDNVSLYLTKAILGPSLKELIFKMGVGALQMTLFDGQGGNMSNMGGGSYVPGYGYRPAINTSQMPYNMLSNPGYAQPMNGNVPIQQGVRVNVRDISFQSRDDVYVVIDRMNNIIRQYGKVKVADFYNLSGITGQEDNWTLQNCGWYNLMDAKPVACMNGRFIIDFPPVVRLS